MSQEGLERARGKSSWTHACVQRRQGESELLRRSSSGCVSRPSVEVSMLESTTVESGRGLRPPGSSRDA
eukprot:scaffold22124_cov30-Tisochrysis_lutea.AAC.2